LLIEKKISGREIVLVEDGRLDCHYIPCPRHGVSFDVRTGKVLSLPGGGGGDG